MVSELSPTFPQARKEPRRLVPFSVPTLRLRCRASPKVSRTWRLQIRTSVSRFETPVLRAGPHGESSGAEVGIFPRFHGEMMAHGLDVSLSQRNHIGSGKSTRCSVKSSQDSCSLISEWYRVLFIWSLLKKQRWICQRQILWLETGQRSEQTSPLWGNVTT